MVLMYFLFTTPNNQLTGHERISPQTCEKVFDEFPLHIPALYGSTPSLLKNETVFRVSVKLGIFLTCKPKCKGLFRSRRACKDHRTTQCKLANVKCETTFLSLYLPCIYLNCTPCESSLRQLVATFNRLKKPV